MDLNFNLDLDAGELHVIIDGSITFSVISDDDGFRYRNLDRLDDEELQEKLKTICQILLSLDGY